jgi:hypothetical protein
MKSLAGIVLLLLTFNADAKWWSNKPNDQTVVRNITTDQQVIQRCDEGLKEVLKYVEDHPDLFKKGRAGLYTLEEKQQIWNTWKRFLDYELALESMGRNYKDYAKFKGADEANCFYTGYAAATTEYRYALEFLDLVDRNPALDKLLNEAVADIGLKENGYAKFKFQFLNAGRGIEFAAREIVYDSYARKYPAPDQARAKENRDRIWAMGKGKGEQMTFKNAWNIVRTTGFNAWLPLQDGVSEWMGDTKIYRVDKNLITQEQIAQLKLQPGDILLERREWYLSNVGLPGYWPHAALYIGTPEERRDYFTDAEVREWVRSKGESSGEIDGLLKRDFPEAYKEMAKLEHENPHRVLEAMSEGVSFTSLEHSAEADSLGVLRPRLNKTAKAEALYRAFRYAGRPYDFNFDFDTDQSLVCTELVCKAYEPNGTSKGLSFPVEMMLGRKVTPANLMAKQFDEQFGKAEQQCDLIYFLDGNEKAKKAVNAGLENFRKSWRRPKWHILMQ